MFPARSRAGCGVGIRQTPPTCPHRHGAKAPALINRKHTEGRSAQPRRFFEQCIEDRFEVTGRGIDDLQHLGGYSLLLERLASR